MVLVRLRNQHKTPGDYMPLFKRAIVHQRFRFHYLRSSATAARITCVSISHIMPMVRRWVFTGLIFGSGLCPWSDSDGCAAGAMGPLGMWLNALIFLSSHCRHSKDTDNQHQSHEQRNHSFCHCETSFLWHHARIILLWVYIPCTQGAGADRKTSGLQKHAYSPYVHRVGQL